MGRSEESKDRAETQRALRCAESEGSFECGSGKAQTFAPFDDQDKQDDSMGHSGDFK